jgi:hypothetical protein
LRDVTRPSVYNAALAGTAGAVSDPPRSEGGEKLFGRKVLVDLAIVKNEGGQHIPEPLPLDPELTSTSLESADFAYVISEVPIVLKRCVPIVPKLLEDPGIKATVARDPVAQPSHRPNGCPFVEFRGVRTRAQIVDLH